MKVSQRISPIWPLKVVAMATSLEGSQNESLHYQPLPLSASTNPENLLIGPVLAEITRLESRPLRKKRKKNKVTQAKHIVRRTSMPGGLN